MKLTYFKLDLQYNSDTGAINKQNLKEGLIDQAMVSPEQKKAAGRKLDSCLAETFSIPKSLKTFYLKIVLM